MKQILLFLIILQAFEVLGQNVKDCDCQAVLDLQFLQPVPVLDRANRKENYLIQNNADTESYFSFHISRDSADYFGVTPYSVDEKKYAWGWVEKGHVGVYARNYTTDSPLILYRKPDKKAKPKSIVEKWVPNLYRILQCQGKWLYVTLELNGKNYQGWMEPQMQCANAYSTCN